MYKVNWNKNDGLLEDKNIKDYYNRQFPGYFITGDTLTETFPDDSCITHVIFKSYKNNPTRYMMCRDRGDHFIIGRYSRFDRIDKDTLKITVDVEDK